MLHRSETTYRFPSPLGEGGPLDRMRGKSPRRKSPLRIGIARVHSVVNRLSDDLHHSLRVGQNGVVPEPQNLIAAMLEKSSPIGILSLCLAMLTTIRLDYQPRLTLREIGNVGTDRDLSPKLDPEQIAVAQPGPKAGLCRSLVLAHCAGEMLVLVDGSRHPATSGRLPSPGLRPPSPKGEGKWSYPD